MLTDSAKNHADPLSLLPSSEALEALALKHQGAFAGAKPFPHIVLDDFLDANVVRSAAELFPDKDSSLWRRTRIANELKASLSEEAAMPAGISNLLRAFNSATFIRFLEKLTGIDGLIPDPYFEGGGLHQIEREGKLDLHVDFNRHSKLRLDRRLNLLLYLNEDWKEEYQGHLELWDRKSKTCAARLLPILNRCVVFSTDEQSIHGHPTPLNCPTDRARRSLALYYYTNGRPKKERAFVHGTEFFSHLSQPQSRTLRHRLTAFARQVLPPFCYALLKRAAVAAGRAH